MREPHTPGVLLTCCHGYAVAAGGGHVGVVETPVFSGSSLVPVSLIVRTAETIPGTFRVVPLALVADVDAARREIALSVDRTEVSGLDELEPARQSSSAVRASVSAAAERRHSIFAGRRGP